jgi:hypothetical protein
VRGDEAAHPLNPTKNENCPGPAQQLVAASFFPPLGIENTDENRKMEKSAFNWKQIPVSTRDWSEEPGKSAALKKCRPGDGSKFPKLP